MPGLDAVGKPLLVQLCVGINNALHNPGAVLAIARRLGAVLHYG